MPAFPPDPPPAPDTPPGERLRDRLRRLGAAGGGRARAGGSAPDEDTRPGVDAAVWRWTTGEAPATPARSECAAAWQWMDHAPAGPNVSRDHLTRGVRVEGGDGVEILRAEFVPDRRHGRCVLRDAIDAVASPAADDAGASAERAGAGRRASPPPVPGGRLWGLDLARTLYLDIETTGLAGGTGTYAFLIGVVRVAAGGGLVAEQFLLRRLGAEPRLLACLRERLAAARHIVTFNGRRFDWPILEARAVLTRQGPLPIEEHTDLIYPARRLWHRVLGTHRLAALESEVLGASRPSDIPGWLIPGIYVEYLRRGDRTLLDPILAHNRADLLAMVALHGEVARCLLDPAGVRTPLDWEGAGVLLARQARHRQALQCFERARERAHDPQTRWRVLRRLARQHRLLGDGEGASRRWEHEALIWTRPDRYRIHVLEEIAKARGRRGDVRGARQAAAAALGLVQSAGAGLPGSSPRDCARIAERLRQRIARLERQQTPLLRPRPGEATP
jgi:uncharacterized protein YprB with RNaseH-like and TPR domain